MKKGLLILRLSLFFCFTLVLSCADNETPPEAIENEYVLGDSVNEINTTMYWEYAGPEGGVDQIRLFEPLLDPDVYDLIVLSPVTGPSSLEGSYVFSKTGDVGTYDLKFVHATDGEGTQEWYTNGEDGARLQIRTMGKNQNGQVVYRILLPEFNLNYGYWDYLAGKWVSLGNKAFALSYEGPID